jgi:hypothetical protein
MKKLFYLFLLALPIALVSCSDDNDLPDVSFNIVVGTNNTIVDNTIYVPQGDDLSVQQLSCTNNDVNKAAVITNATYFLDGYRLGTTLVAPFTISIPTTDLSVGKHTLSIETTVLAVDKTPAFAVVSYPVEVVASASDMPGAAK